MSFEKAFRSYLKELSVTQEAKIDRLTDKYGIESDIWERTSVDLKAVKDNGSVGFSVLLSEKPFDLHRHLHKKGPKGDMQKIVDRSLARILLKDLSNLPDSQLINVAKAMRLWMIISSIDGENSLKIKRAGQLLRGQRKLNANECFRRIVSEMLKLDPNIGSKFAIDLITPDKIENLQKRFLGETLIKPLLDKSNSEVLYFTFSNETKIQKKSFNAAQTLISRCKNEATR